MENNAPGKMTRRGFVAVCAAVRVVPKGTALDSINPERDMHQVMYACSVGTGWVKEFWPPKQKSPYWHGLPPVVKLDLRMPWEK